MADKEIGKIAPAYVPWRTFMNFINGLRETDVPSQINRSVMTNLSYSAQAQLLSGLRYLGLINTDGKPLANLSRFVGATEATQKEIIKAIITERYGFVFNALDLSRASSEELEKQFRAEGIGGSTVVRATSFFLGAAEAAGIQLSAHLKKKTSVAPATRRQRVAKRKVRNGANGQDETPPPAAVPTDMMGKLLEKFPQFDPNWPDPIKTKWFEGFDRLMVSAAKKEGQS
jgi:hypothetical protein